MMYRELDYYPLFRGRRFYSRHIDFKGHNIQSIPENKEEEKIMTSNPKKSVESQLKSGKMRYYSVLRSCGHTENIVLSSPPDNFLRECACTIPCRLCIETA